MAPGMPTIFRSTGSKPGCVSTSKDSGDRSPRDASPAGSRTRPISCRPPPALYVLRQKPAGPLLPSAHAVDREFRVMRALEQTSVPVPRVHALCEDDEVIGSAFYVMQFLDGRILWDQRLPEASPAERAAMFDSMNAVIAALHTRRLRRPRARRFRAPRQLHGAADRALEPAVPRLRDRADRGDGPADRLAAAASAARKRAGDRPWRLPHGQSRLSQDRSLE